MKRGEVWWASMPSPMGRWPVLVVQSNSFNDSRVGTVVVALITSNLALAGAPGNVRLSQGEGGIPNACVANVSQLYAADRRRLTDRLGAVGASVLQRVDAGLRLVLGLSDGADRAGAMEPAVEYAVRRAASVSFRGAKRRGVT